MTYLFNAGRSVNHFTSPPNYPVDAVIKEGQQREGNNPLYQQSCRIDIKYNVVIVQPQLGRRRQRPIAVFERLHHELHLQQFGDVKHHREDEHGNDVGGRHSRPRIGPFALVVILYRPPHGSEPLQGQGHRDVDRAAEHEVVQRVEEVAERVFVHLTESLVLSQAFENRADDIDVVEDGQKYQEFIEDGIHLLDKNE